MPRARAGRIAVIFGALCLAACGGTVPGPDTVAQPHLAYDQVPYPPPPARVETVPAAPDKRAVWVDGGWRWRGKHWSWWLGRWVVAPAGAHYAREAVMRSKTGALLAAPGAWFDAKGQPMPEPAPLAFAGAGEGDVVDGEGHVVTVGKNRRGERETPQFSPACDIATPPGRPAPVDAAVASEAAAPAQDNR